MAQVVEHLLCKHKAKFKSGPTTTKSPKQLFCKLIGKVKYKVTVHQ
jgi:hypothetical protein